MDDPEIPVEHIMRAKLPAWQVPPVGECMDDGYRSAIHANLPDGFEVHWASRESWPVDKEGLTWVRIFCTDHRQALAMANMRYAQLVRELTRIKGLARQILG